jgi:hypothetical protein
MPAFIKTKEDEALWKRSKAATIDQYGDIEKSDPEKFFSIVTTIYKNMCKKGGCSPFKNEANLCSRSMKQLLERIETMSIADAIKEKKKAEKWFKGLNDREIGQIGDDLVNVEFDWRDWLDEKPSSAFKNKLMDLCNDYEVSK